MHVLTSLEIKNFRTFEHLRIERLGRVNLVLGKNNVGKTAFLEALRFYAMGSATALREMLVNHDELAAAGTTGAAERWQSIVDRLANEGYDRAQIPRTCGRDGTVTELPLSDSPRSVRFGVWIMPDNQSPGMLEDFVAGLIRQDDPMLRRVDQFLDSLPAGIRRFLDEHRAKARIHTWLATSERPGRPMGQAVKADAQIDTAHPAVEPFLDWICAVFVDQAFATDREEN